MSNPKKIWVLLCGYEYDSADQFMGWWSRKPTIKQLTELGFSEKYADILRKQGTFLDHFHTQWYLQKINEGMY